MKRSLPLMFITILACPLVAPAEQVTIIGTVTGPDGAPVADCAVRTLSPPREGALRWAGIETTTDGDGRFELAFQCDRSPRSYAVSVWAVKEGLAIGWGRFESGAELAIEVGGTPSKVRGKLVDDQGNPLPALRAWVSHASVGEGEGRSFVSFGDSEPVLQARTDEDGRFELGDLPPGARAWVAAGGTGWAQAAVWAVAAPDGGEEITITMHPEAVISGRVTRDGQPMAGVHVYAQGDPRRRTSVDTVEAESTPDGTYRIDGLPANAYKVRLVPRQGLLAVAHEGLELGAGDHAENINFELIEGAIVEGTVTLEDTGEPAAGVWVGAEGPAASSARTDERGHYRLRVAPGNNLVKCGSLGTQGYDRAEPGEVWVEAREGEPARGVDFVLKLSPVFSGVILGPGGEPLAGAEVWVLRPESRFEWPHEAERSDQDGHFRVTPYKFRSHGPWLIFAQHTERDLAGLAVAPERQDDMTLQLRPAAYLASAALNLEDNPVPDVGVLVQAWPDRARPAPLPFRYATDGDGQLSVGPLPPNVTLRMAQGRSGADAELLAFAVNDAWPMYKRFSLQPGQTRRMPALRLNLTGRSLSGVVIDEQREVVAGATLVRKWQGSTRSESERERATTVTDNQGRFTLTRLKAKGAVTVMAVSPDGRRAVALKCDPDVEVEVILQLQEPGVLVGVVYGADGKPAAGVEVGVSSVGGSFPLREQAGAPLKFWASVKTDERGRWRLEGLVPGLAYDCQHKPPGPGGSQRVKRFVAEGGEMPMVLDIYRQ